MFKRPELYEKVGTEGFGHGWLRWREEYSIHTIFYKSRIKYILNTIFLIVTTGSSPIKKKFNRNALYYRVHTFRKTENQNTYFFQRKTKKSFFPINF